MNIANIKRFSFTKYEVAIINIVRGCLNELESANDPDDGKGLKIGFCQDVVVIHWVDGDNIVSTEFEMLQGKVTINNFEPSDEIMKLYCQSEYVANLAFATKSKSGEHYMQGAYCNTFNIERDDLADEIDVGRLHEFADYLCPSLLEIV